MADNVNAPDVAIDFAHGTENITLMCAKLMCRPGRAKNAALLHRADAVHGTQIGGWS